MLYAVYCYKEQLDILGISSFPACVIEINTFLTWHDTRTVDKAKWKQLGVSLLTKVQSKWNDESL